MSSAPDDVPTYDRVIHWFRRDLRIVDNTALLAAAASEAVLPTYILSDWKGDHAWTSAKRQMFLCGCLESLSQNLGTIDGKLIIRCGDAVKELVALAKEQDAQAIFANRDVDPFGKEQEKQLKDAAAEVGIAVHYYDDVMMHRADVVLKDDGDPYRVYTPYSRKWLAQDFREPAGKPEALSTPDGIDSLDLPTLDHWGLSDDDFDILEPGEKAARTRLATALDDVIKTYDDTRDRPAIAGTSRLSQDLRWGTISIRYVYHKVRARQNRCDSASSEQIQKYIKELAWRDFYMQILHHYPDVLEQEFNAQWRGLPWDEPSDQFAAFKEGRTGFPIVDAGVRELLKTGFMHNRVRMIVAMFLTKDLHIDWRLGEQFFAQHLVDGEIASNNGGWQWSAGTGADAAPYFRIQNPWTQSKRHDPRGEYVKKWIPELADVPAKKFFEAPENGEPIAKDYPLPIVDHSTERDRTLSIFKKHKENAQ